MVFLIVALLWDPGIQTVLATRARWLRGVPLVAAHKNWDTRHESMFFFNTPYFDIFREIHVFLKVRGFLLGSVSVTWLILLRCHTSMKITLITNLCE